jgi:KUP system potassium uptake protein
MPMQVSESKHSAISEPALSRTGFMTLVIGSIGVVYGDIGTSPLYAFKEAITAAGGAERGAVLGVLSLILRALIIVVTLKYVLILLYADNHAEGGTLALMALAEKALGGRGIKIAMLGIAGAALFFGDAIITPAISVLSAMEGLKLATPLFEPYILPITLVILVALFAIQSRGTARVAAYFGPITAAWFVVLAIAGVVQIVKRPEVLAAVYPGHATGARGLQVLPNPCFKLPLSKLPSAHAQPVALFSLSLLRRGAGVGHLSDSVCLRSLPWVRLLLR